MSRKTKAFTDGSLSKRSFLKTVGCGAVLASAPTTASADNNNNPNKSRILKELSGKYGKEAAKPATGIILRNWERKEKGKLSQAQYHHTVTETLLDHPKAYVIGRDVRQLEEKIDQHNAKQTDSKTEQTDSKTGSASTQTYSTVSTSSTNELAVGSYKSYRDSGALGATSLDYEYYDGTSLVDVVNASATATIYANAINRIRFYNSFTPDNDGNYNFQISYDRTGGPISGSATFSAYRRKPNGSLNKETLETVDSTVNGRVTRDATFYLQAGKEYTVGYEIYLQASTAGGGSTVDFYENASGVDPDYAPTYEWTYLG